MDPRQKDPHFVQCWMQAIARGKLDTLAEMSGGQPWPDIKTRTPDTSGLILACHNGHTKIVKRLLEDGAQVNYQTQDGRTALMACCEGGNGTIARRLLAAGADIWQDTRKGNTLLMLCAAPNNVAVARVLLSRKRAQQTINAHSDEGSFALFEAILEQSAEMALLLLQHGAHPNVRHTKTHERAMDVAISENQSQVVRALVAAGAKLHCLRAKSDRLPLVRAAAQGQREIVEILLDAGADPHKVGHDGLSAMTVPSYKGMASMAQILAERDHAKIHEATPAVAGYKRGMRL